RARGSAARSPGSRRCSPRSGWANRASGTVPPSTAARSLGAGRSPRSPRAWPSPRRTVLVRTLEQLDRNKPYEVALGHLLHRGGEAAHLLAEACLDPDERPLGPDRVRGDPQTLHHLVRVPPEEPAVLEGPRLPFVRVAHDVLRRT